MSTPASVQYNKDKNSVGHDIDALTVEYDRLYQELSLIRSRLREVQGQATTSDNDQSVPDESTHS